MSHMTGTLSIEVDRARTQVRVKGIGFWSPDMAARHFRELQATMAAMRAEAGRVFVLVDLRTASVQSKETAAIIADSTRRIYDAADRAAVVVATELLGMQMRHVTAADRIRTFADMAEAERWLRLERGAREAA